MGNSLLLWRAALCDADGCLGLAGFMKAMHYQIRNFTKSSLADTSRRVTFSHTNLKTTAFNFQNDWLVSFLSFQFPFCRREIIFSQRDSENDDHGPAGLTISPLRMVSTGLFNSTITPSPYYSSADFFCITFAQML